MKRQIISSLYIFNITESSYANVLSLWAHFDTLTGITLPLSDFQSPVNDAVPAPGDDAVFVKLLCFENVSAATLIKYLY